MPIIPSLKEVEHAFIEKGVPLETLPEKLQNGIRYFIDQGMSEEEARKYALLRLVMDPHAFESSKIVFQSYTNGHIKKGIKDLLPGGLADDETIESIAYKHNVPVYTIEKQLEKGIKVEMEHTDDPAKAREIALDHLAEDPYYYTRLSIMEEGFGKPIPKRPQPAKKRGLASLDHVYLLDQVIKIASYIDDFTEAQEVIEEGQTLNLPEEASKQVASLLGELMEATREIENTYNNLVKSIQECAGFLQVEVDLPIDEKTPEALLELIPNLVEEFKSAPLPEFAEGARDHLIHSIMEQVEVLKDKLEQLPKQVSEARAIIKEQKTQPIQKDVIVMVGDNAAAPLVPVSAFLDYKVPKVVLKTSQIGGMVHMATVDFKKVAALDAVIKLAKRGKTPQQILNDLKKKGAPKKIIDMVKGIINSGKEYGRSDAYIVRTIYDKLPKKYLEQPTKYHGPGKTAPMSERE